MKQNETIILDIIGRNYNSLSEDKLGININCKLIRSNQTFIT